MSQTTERKAFTLAEVLIYAIVAILLLAMVYSTLIMVLQVYQNTRNFALLQMEAMKSANEVATELSRSPKSSVSSGADWILMLSSVAPTGRIDYDNSGRVLWQKWILYYRDADNKLLRKELTFAPTSTPPALAPDVNTLVNNQSLPARIVATDITGLASSGAYAGESVTVTASNDLRGLASVNVTLGCSFRPQGE
ncbi:hypothetical protein DYH09_02750 [bacterium CPR1]|nr:hypothetical protein [bacterium CPR1]